MKIPYGISNFEDISTSGYYYVDRTQYIEVLENLSEKFLVFLRPRRFGKSLFCSMLGYYYDVLYKDRFEELFGKYYIGRKPTSRKNSYLVLNLDFSGIETGTKEKLYRDFGRKISRSISLCLNQHQLADQKWIDKITSQETPASIIGEFFNYIHINSNHKLYVIIDEYDLFANDLLAFQPNEFKKHFSSAGFVRNFYEQIKQATKERIVDRIFITGVTPIALDSLSSGFNITKKITAWPEFNQMLGFTAEEVRTIIKKICVECQDVEVVDCQKMFGDLCRYYDGYLFSKESSTRVFNPDMILYFVSEFIRSKRCKYPDNLIDSNIISDYTKIQQMFKVGDYEKNLEKLDELLKEKQLTARLTDINLLDRNRFRSFTTSDFISLLFFLGIITIKGAHGTNLKFVIPNYCIEQLYQEFFIRIIEQRSNVKIEVATLEDCLYEMSQNADIKPLVKMVESFLHGLSFRDFQKFDEKYVKLAILAYLSLTNLYITKTEYEVEDGYVDLALFERSPYEVKYQFAFEIKYLKKSEQDKPKLEAKYSEALEQMQKYRQSNEFTAATNLKTFILIFVGDKCEVCEEVK